VTSLTILPYSCYFLGRSSSRQSDPDIASDRRFGGTPMTRPFTRTAAALLEEAGGRSFDQQLELAPAALAELQRFVRRHVANSADAADIAQQAVLIACAEMGVAQWDNLSRWLLTVARHLIVDHYRSQRRVQFVALVAGLAETQPELQTRPDVALAVAECREQLSRMLNHRICLEHQVAVLLSDVYGYGDTASAAELRMSVPCFKLLLHGARAGLRDIAEHGIRSHRYRSGGAIVQPKNGLGVTCRVPACELVEMRKKLLDGLDC